jgi:hypothetical protein
MRFRKAHWYEFINRDSHAWMERTYIIGRNPINKEWNIIRIGDGYTKHMEGVAMMMPKSWIDYTPAEWELRSAMKSVFGRM